MRWASSFYPACDSFVMAHPGTLEPMGTLAPPELRRLRYEAHQQFDQLHKSKPPNKTERAGRLPKKDNAKPSAGIVGSHPAIDSALYFSSLPATMKRQEYAYDEWEYEEDEP